MEKVNVGPGEGQHGGGQGGSGGEGHLTVYVWWAVVGGLAVSPVVALGVGGIGWMASGEWRVGAVAAGWALFVLLVVIPAGTYLWALLGWAGPRRVERMRQQVVEVPVAGPAPSTRWVTVRPPRASLAERVRGLLPAGGQVVEQMAMEVEGVEPAVDAEVRELYEFIVRAWPGGNVSRDFVRREYGITRSQWERFVGGVRGQEGTESGRGILDRAGCVERTSAGWQVCAGVSMWGALSIEPELQKYAEARAQMVTGARRGQGLSEGGQDGQDGTGRRGLLSRWLGLGRVG